MALESGNLLLTQVLDLVLLDGLGIQVVPVEHRSGLGTHTAHHTTHHAATATATLATLAATTSE